MTPRQAEIRIENEVGDEERASEVEVEEWAGGGGMDKETAYWEMEMRYRHQCPYARAKSHSRSFTNILSLSFAGCSVQHSEMSCNSSNS
jgi:hypothetical protein